MFTGATGTVHGCFIGMNNLLAEYHVAQRVYQKLQRRRDALVDDLSRNRRTDLKGRSTGYN